MRTSLSALAGITAGAVLAAEAVARARELDLDGRVALVTGGSRGLGYILARELLRAGCRVGICGRDEQALASARDGLRADTGRTPLALRCDVGVRSDVSNWVEESRSRLGPVDILVNNAGIIELSSIRDVTVEDIRRAMDVMFWGVVHPTLEVLPEMVARGSGRIANVTSIDGKISFPQIAAYNAAKAAATAFSESIRAELRQDGVLVTTVVPGFMRTGSDVQIRVKGDDWVRRYGRLATLASLPFVTMDAERAARRIVRGIRRGEAELILSLHANVLARASGIAPGLTADALSLVARLLPRPSDRPSAKPVRGRELIDRAREETPLIAALRRWNDDAAERFNQHANAERPH